MKTMQSYRKQTLRFLCGVLCAMLAGVIAKPTCAVQAQPTDASTSVIKIMSYNVHHCEGADNKVDVKRVADRIKAENPDFACINEIKPDVALELGKKTGMHVTPCGMGSFNAILSRVPATRTDEVALRWNKYGPRSLMICDYTKFAVGVMHFEYAPKVLNSRMDSAAIVCKTLAKYDKPVFITGDWNSEPQSEPVTLMRNCLKILSDEHVRTWHGFGLYKTFQPGKKEYCIDYVAVNLKFADRVSVVETYLVKDNVTSDHYPVVATLRLKAASN